MPTCQNCGAHVTKTYIRVLEPGPVAHARVCPFCEDLIRTGNVIRKARSRRH